MAFAAVVVSIGQFLAELYLRADLHENFSQQIALAVLWSLLFTPILIAVHRFILLGEITSSYRIEPARRFMLFFLWSLVIDVGILAFAALVTFFLNMDPRIGLFWMLVLFVFLYVSLRLSLLFPAIAVDAPGTSFINAYRDTKGRVLKILMIFLMCVLPLLFLLFGSELLLRSSAQSEGTSLARLIDALLSGVVGAFYIVVLIVAVSRLYEWMADRLRTA